MDAAEFNLRQRVTYVHVLETHSYWIHKDGEYLPQAFRGFSQRMLPKAPEVKEVRMSPTFFNTVRFTNAVKLTVPTSS
jgi:hypothetical protein